MDMCFRNKIQLQVIIIYQARDVATFNFKVHKSLEHLDLSTNDYQVRRKSIFTKEDIRKWIQPNRQILYKHHLDLPTDFESLASKERTEIVTQTVFHLGSIFVCDSIYGLGFETFIVKAIKSHDGNKAEKLRSYMKILRLLNYRQSLDTSLYFYEELLPVLYRERCGDSKLVMNFICIFNFIWWLFNSENPAILKYVLHHAQTLRCSNHMWKLLQPEMNPVNMCFLRHKIINVRILLMFGTPLTIPPAFNFSRYINIPDRFFYGAVHRGVVSYKRAFLMFQLLYDFLNHEQSPEGLRCLWNSIKDPFLSHSEIFFTLIPILPLQIILRVHAYYAMFVTDCSCFFYPSPRSLKHLCRVEVRKWLNSCYQLPHGITCLDIPENLKSYLYEF